MCSEGKEMMVLGTVGGGSVRDLGIDMADFYNAVNGLEDGCCGFRYRELS